MMPLSEKQASVIALNGFEDVQSYLPLTYMLHFILIFVSKVLSILKLKTLFLLYIYFDEFYILERSTGDIS